MSRPASGGAPGAAAAAAVGAAIAAAIPVLVLSGFTVDDALVPARYAASLAAGDGYRPSAHAPPSDGVTPLGFAHLLAPFASGGVLAAHHAARVLGAAAWIAAAAALGAAIARVGGSRWRFAALAIVATSAPVGAWAGAGLETGLVAALVAGGLALRETGRDRAGALALGCAAAWRPELVPAAILLAFVGGPVDISGAGAPGADEVAEPSTDPRARVVAGAGARAVRVAIALAPAAVVAVTRLVVFGRAAPLSSVAKAPVWSLGVAYAGAAFLLAGLVAVVAPLGLARARGWTRALAAAVVAHTLAMAVAGGDWMPLARLAVPLVPAVVLGSARLLASAPRGARLPPGAPALALAIAMQVFGAARSWGATHAVVADRAHLIEAVRPVLAGARVVAAVDVGWVGAAAPHARIVDLAGITDPGVAALGGGHTSRRIPRTLLDDRRVDALVLLLAAGEEADPDAPWTALRYARATEAWIAAMPGIEAEYELVHVHGRRPRYVVLARRPLSR